MTLIVRRVGPTSWHRLRKCGRCRCGLGVIVGMFPSSKFSVVFLEDDQ